MSSWASSGPQRTYGNGLPNSDNFRTTNRVVCAPASAYGRGRGCPLPDQSITFNTDPNRAVSSVGPYGSPGLPFGTTFGLEIPRARMQDNGYSSRVPSQSPSIAGGQAQAHSRAPSQVGSPIPSHAVPRGFASSMYHHGGAGRMPSGGGGDSWGGSGTGVTEVKAVQSQEEDDWGSKPTVTSTNPVTSSINLAASSGPPATLTSSTPKPAIPKPLEQEDDWGAEPPANFTPVTSQTQGGRTYARIEATSAPQPVSAAAAVPVQRQMEEDWGSAAGPKVEELVQPGPIKAPEEDWGAEPSSKPAAVRANVGKQVIPKPSVTPNTTFPDQPGPAGPAQTSKQEDWGSGNTTESKKAVIPIAFEIKEEDWGSVPVASVAAKQTKQVDECRHGKGIGRVTTTCTAAPEAKAIALASPRKRELGEPGANLAIVVKSDDGWGGGPELAKAALVDDRPLEKKAGDSRKDVGVPGGGASSPVAAVKQQAFFEPPPYHTNASGSASNAKSPQTAVAQSQVPPQPSPKVLAPPEEEDWGAEPPALPTKAQTQTAVQVEARPFTESPNVSTRASSSADERKTKDIEARGIADNARREAEQAGSENAVSAQQAPLGRDVNIAQQPQGGPPLTATEEDWSSAPPLESQSSSQAQNIGTGIPAGGKEETQRLTPTEKSQAQDQQQQVSDELWGSTPPRGRGSSTAPAPDKAALPDWGSSVQREIERVPIIRNLVVANSGPDGPRWSSGLQVTPTSLPSEDWGSGPTSADGAIASAITRQAGIPASAKDGPPSPTTASVCKERPDMNVRLNNGNPSLGQSAIVKRIETSTQTSQPWGDEQIMEARSLQSGFTGLPGDSTMRSTAQPIDSGWSPPFGNRADGPIEPIVCSNCAGSGHREAQCPSPLVPLDERQRITPKYHPSMNHALPANPCPCGELHWRRDCRAVWTGSTQSEPPLRPCVCGGDHWKQRCPIPTISDPRNPLPYLCDCPGTAESRAHWRKDCQYRGGTGSHGSSYGPPSRTPTVPPAEGHRWAPSQGWGPAASSGFGNSRSPPPIQGMASKNGTPGMIQSSSNASLSRWAPQQTTWSEQHVLPAVQENTSAPGEPADADESLEGPPKHLSTASPYDLTAGVIRDKDGGWSKFREGREGANAEKVDRFADAGDGSSEKEEVLASGSTSVQSTGEPAAVDDWSGTPRAMSKPLETPEQSADPSVSDNDVFDPEPPKQATDEADLVSDRMTDPVHNEDIERLQEEAPSEDPHHQAATSISVPAAMQEPEFKPESTPSPVTKPQRTISTATSLLGLPEGVKEVIQIGSDDGQDSLEGVSTRGAPANIGATLSPGASKAVSAPKINSASVRAEPATLPRPVEIMEPLETSRAVPPDSEVISSLKLALQQKDLQLLEQQHRATQVIEALHAQIRGMSHQLQDSDMRMRILQGQHSEASLATKRMEGMQQKLLKTQIDLSIAEEDARVYKREVALQRSRQTSQTTQAPRRPANAIEYPQDLLTNLSYRDASVQRLFSAVRHAPPQVQTTVQAAYISPSLPEVTTRTTFNADATSFIPSSVSPAPGTGPALAPGSTSTPAAISTLESFETEQKVPVVKTHIEG